MRLGKERALWLCGLLTQAMGKVLVIQHRGVYFERHKVDGQGRDFGNHHPPQGIGHGGIRVGENKFDEVVLWYEAGRSVGAWGKGERREGEVKDEYLKL